MPRQNRRRRDDATAPDAAALGRGAVRRESGPDGDWWVRSVTGAAATKAYRCPGCDQLIRPATPHLVAWPDDGAEPFNEPTGSSLGDGRLAERRHWHTPCWTARARRRPSGGRR